MRYALALGIGSRVAKEEYIYGVRLILPVFQY